MKASNVHFLDIRLDPSDKADVQVAKTSNGNEVVYVSVNGVTVLRMVNDKDAAKIDLNDER
jgi:hypothetical protein